MENSNKVLGVKRKEVVLVPHQQVWKEMFQKEQMKIFKLFPYYEEIEHVGSTAIKDIYAKPIIDIAIKMNFEKLDDFSKVLELLGYDSLIKLEEGWYYSVKREAELSLIHLHVYETSNTKFEKIIFFKNYLNDHEIDRKAYEILKKQLYKQYFNNRHEYTAKKACFINNILKQFNET